MADPIMMQSVDTALVYYERDGDVLRLKLTNISNHELREVMVGLWCRLQKDDRLDHIRELRSYFNDPGAWLSPVAAAIKLGPDNPDAIDLLKLARGPKVRP
jgi:hypothetical protein